MDYPGFLALTAVLVAALMSVSALLYYGFTLSSGLAVEAGRLAGYTPGRVELVGVYTGDRLYYAVRNTGPVPVAVTVEEWSGASRVLVVGSFSLKPGEVEAGYVNASSLPRGAYLVAYGRGVLAASPVLDLSSGSSLPAFGFHNPLSSAPTYRILPGLQFTATARLLVVGLLQAAGPGGVVTLYHLYPLYSAEGMLNWSGTGSSGGIQASYSAATRIVNGRLRLEQGFQVSSPQGNLSVVACIAAVWTMNLPSTAGVEWPPSASRVEEVSSGDTYVADYQVAVVTPPGVSTRQLLAILADPSRATAEFSGPLSGTVTAVLAHCVKVRGNYTSLSLPLGGTATVPVAPGVALPVHGWLELYSRNNYVGRTPLDNRRVMPSLSFNPEDLALALLEHS